jgi:RNA polymerase sigma factor (sigma-70 family)
MSDEGFSFERDWPATAERLTIALRRRRIPSSLIDDLVQETALRLYERREHVDPERGTWPLAFTVAMNILKDQLRAEVRRRAIDPPHVAMEQDPEIVALARLELKRVRIALRKLPPAQRAALLAEVGESDDNGRSSSAVKMLRMRARKRLKMLTEDASAFMASCELFTQRVVDKVSDSPMAFGAAACAPLTLGVLTFGLIASTSPVHANATGLEGDRPRVARSAVDPHAISDLRILPRPAPAVLNGEARSPSRTKPSPSRRQRAIADAHDPKETEGGGVILPDLGWEPGDGGGSPAGFEGGDASAGPEGFRARVHGFIGNARGRAALRGRLGGTDQTGPRPRIEGGAQFDGTGVRVKLGD